MIVLDDKDVLLVVDVQNDFCSHGALAVPNGEQVVSPINALMAKFVNVVLTQDFHPMDHISFASNHLGKLPYEMIEVSYGQQVLWPNHCVEGTLGAQFHPDLCTSKAQLVIRKGHHQNIDSYSAFLEADRRTKTGLAGFLKEKGIERVFMAGLATDFCVASSALDAVDFGFDCVVLSDACRAIDINGSLQKAWLDMTAKGVGQMTCHDL